MCETIGERHASACRYKNAVPLGSRRSARRTQFANPSQLIRHRWIAQESVPIHEICEPQGASWMLIEY